MGMARGIARRAAGPAGAGRPRPGGRAVRRLAAALLVGSVVLLMRPDAAGAHAELVSSEPASGAQLDSSPPQVLLSFTESVELPDDGVELLDASGEPVRIPAPRHPGGDRSRVAVDLPALGDGAYVVSWRIISEDSHPIGGAFTFAVGDASVADARALAGDVSAGAGASRSLGVVFGVARFATFAGVALLVGGAAFLLALWPAGLDDRRARRVVAGAWWVATLSTAAGIALQAAYAEGGTLADALDPGLVGDELATRSGRIWLARLALLAVVAGGARLAAWSPGRTPRVRQPVGSPPVGSPPPAGPGARPEDDTPAGTGGPDPAGAAPGAPSAPGEAPAGGVPPVPDEVTYVAALLGLGLLVTVSYAGHAGSGRWVPVAMVADLVHLAGVSAWLGGLALLALCVLRPARGDGGPGGLDAAGVAASFSPVAFAAVVAIAASGAVQGWRQLGSVSALWGTTYGRLLAAKVLLVAVMLVAAGASRSWVRGREAAAATRDLAGIRRSVAVEVAVAVLVLAVTAGLVESVPGRVAGDEPAGVPFTTEEHGNEVLVDLTVDPTTPGPTDITVVVKDHDGAPARPEEVTAQLRLPERELGPLTVALDDRGDGTYASSDAELPFPGAWELLVLVRTSDIAQDRFTTTFDVRQ
jgi:copper transport protein